MRKIKFIGYSCGWGAKIDGCKDGPAYFKDNFNNEFIKNYDWQDIYKSPLGISPDNKLLLIEDYCKKLSENVEGAIKSDNFPITIGGDHSMAIGTWSGVTKALKSEGDFGLIWFDAHMDSHTPETSHTGRYHGMPLAALLGKGEDSLCNIGSSKTKLNPKNICLIGIRSFEKEEAELLKEMGVKIFYMDEVKKLGLKKVVDEALKIVQKAKGGFGVTIDLDAFDPEFAPGTGCHEYGGLEKDEFIAAVTQFSGNENMQALEIAEYDPSRDKEHITFKLINSMINAIING